MRMAVPFAVILPDESTRNTVGVPAALTELIGMPTEDSASDAIAAIDAIAVALILRRLALRGFVWLYNMSFPLQKVGNNVYQIGL